MKEDRQNGKEGEREKFHMSCIGKLILVLCQGGTMTVEPASEHYWPPHRRRWASAGNSSYLYWVVGSLIQQRTEQTCGQQPLSLSLRICGFMVPVCHCVCVCVRLSGRDVSVHQHWLWIWKGGLWGRPLKIQFQIYLFQGDFFIFILTTTKKNEKSIPLSLFVVHVQ